MQVFWNFPANPITKKRKLNYFTLTQIIGLDKLQELVTTEKHRKKKRKYESQLDSTRAIERIERAATLLNNNVELYKAASV